MVSMLKHFDFEPSFQMRWCRARDLFGSQIPVATGRFELRIFSTRSGLGNYFVCKRFVVQALLWSLEFVIEINLEHDTIAGIYVVTNIAIEILVYKQLSF